MVFTFKYRISVVKKTTQELFTTDTSWEKTTTTFRYAYTAGGKKYRRYKNQPTQIAHTYL
jgi:hypothetical protein